MPMNLPLALVQDNGNEEHNDVERALPVDLIAVVGADLDRNFSDHFLPFTPIPNEGAIFECQ